MEMSLRTYTLGKNKGLVGICNVIFILFGMQCLA